MPDALTDNEFPARTPVDRSVERGWRTGAKPVIDARTEKGKQDTSDHARNFLDCVASREKCNCDVEVGHRSATVCHLGNIAVRSGRKIAWDPAKEQIVGDDETARMLSRPYRGPWKLPD